MVQEVFGRKMAEPERENAARLRKLYEQGVPYYQAAKELDMVSTDAFMHYKAFQHGFSSRGDFSVYVALRKLYREGIPKILDRLPAAGYSIESMGSIRESRTDTLELALADDNSSLTEAKSDIALHIEECAAIIKELISDSRAPEKITVSIKKGKIYIKPQNSVDSRAFMHAYALILKREAAAPKPDKLL